MFSAAPKDLVLTTPKGYSKASPLQEKATTWQEKADLALAIADAEKREAAAKEAEAKAKVAEAIPGNEPGKALAAALHKIYSQSFILDPTSSRTMLANRRRSGRRGIIRIAKRRHNVRHAVALR